MNGPPGKKAAPNRQERGGVTDENLKFPSHASSLLTSAKNPDVVTFTFAPEIERAFVSLLWHHPDLLGTALSKIDPQIAILQPALSKILSAVDLLYRGAGVTDFALERHPWSKRGRRMISKGSIDAFLEKQARAAGAL